MLRSLLLAGCAGAAVMIGGVNIARGPDASSDEYALLYNPLEFARALCGRADDNFASRRAPFIKAAAAYAAATNQTADAPPSLYDGLGDFSFFPITTSQEGAQAYFNQGLKLAYGFNHGEAVRAFRWGQELDPNCAMCAWGEALVLGPNINAAIDPTTVEAARAAIDKALSLKDGVSQKERMLIEALDKRYGDGPVADRSAYDAAYAEAMGAVHRAFPDDDDIAAMYAEAMMDTQPWNYWESDGVTPRGYTAEIIRVIETVLERNPNHAAAIHLYIHMTEASDDPYRAEAGADRLAALMPAAGHIVHMPSHNYYRTGRFIDSLSANVDAVAADEAYLAVVDNPSPLYRFGYYVHNVHFLMTSAQMAGDGATALAMAKKLDESLPTEMAMIAPSMRPIKASPYFAMAQFGEPDEVLAAADPGETSAFLKAMWRYARGAAYVRQGDYESARAEAALILAAQSDPEMDELESYMVPVPARSILKIAANVVSARAAMAENDLSTAITLLEQAVVLQDALPYTEPPYWYYPTRQTLGAALLQDGQTKRAERVLFQALIDSPNNGWVLYALGEAHDALGDRAGARHMKGLFKEAWVGDARAFDMTRL